MLKRLSLFLAFCFLAPHSVAAHEAPKTSAEKMEYIEKYLQLFEIESSYIKTYSDEEVPAFRYAIKNTGRETLTKIEVLVYFLDKEGTPFFEENYFPVLVSDSGFNDSRPLKPNYTFRMESNKWMTEKSLGEEWGGEIDIEIVEIELSE